MVVVMKDDIVVYRYSGRGGVLLTFCKQNVTFAQVLQPMLGPTLVRVKMFED